MKINLPMPSRIVYLFVSALIFIGFSSEKTLAQMAYVSSEVTSVAPQMVGVNTLQARVALLNVVTTGTTNPLTLSQIEVGIGQTNLINVLNVEVFYTGSTATFNNTTPFGQGLAPTLSALIFTGSQALGAGNNYFWITYDIPATAIEDSLYVLVNNIVINSSNYSPSPNTPSAKRFIKLPLSGSYTVGTGGDFELLSAATSNINIRGLSGNTEFKIISNITETVAASLNEWQELGTGNYTLTIVPDDAQLRTITSSASTLFLMSGADRVIIDGRYNGSGKYLAFNNTNIAQSICVFFNTSVSNTNGCNNSIVRNCIFYSGTLTHTFAVNVHMGATGHNNILITENECKKGYYGINIGVPVGSNQANALYNGIVVTNNIIGGTSAAETITANGIRMWNTDGALINGNEIRNIITSSAINNAGIDLSTNAVNAIVTGNKIYGIRNNHASGYGASGIALTGGGGHQIINNLVYDIDAFSFSAGNIRSVYGIRASSGANHQVFHNTISLSGVSQATAANVSHGIGFIGATAADFRNNIIENKMAGPAGFKSYGIYQSASSTISASNSNNYFVDGPNSTLAFLNGSDRVSLADVQAALGQDLNSFFGNPDFDANWVSQSCFANNTAEPLANISEDFAGALRSTTPDMGAIEYSPQLPAPPVVITPVFDCRGNASNPLSATVLNAANWYNDSISGQFSGTTPIPSTATAGVFSYWVSDSIASTGCNSQRSRIDVTIGEITAITQQPAGTIVCEGEQVELMVTAIGHNLSYKWFKNGTLLPVTVAPTLLFSQIGLTDAGSYTVEAEGACGPSVVSDVALVQVNELPTVVAHASANSICEGAAVTLSGTGAPVLIWPTPITNPVYFPAGTHTLTLTGIDANGCENTDDITIIVNALPTISITASADTICSGGTVTMTGSGATSYFWNNNYSNGNPIQLFNTTNFMVHGIDNNGCSNSAEKTITVNPLPSVSLDKFDTLCHLISTYVLSGGMPTGGVYSGPGVGQGIFTPSDAGAGTHTIIYSYMNQNGCIGTASNEIVVEICGGIVNKTIGKNLKLYPNPASSLINLELSSQANEEAIISIISADGKSVLSEKALLSAGSNVITINSHEFARGIYYVQVLSATNLLVEKLILR
jgi:hypothetical protein